METKAIEVKASEVEVGKIYLSRKGREVKILSKKENEIVVELVGVGTQAIVPADYGFIVEEKVGEKVENQGGKENQVVATDNQQGVEKAKEATKEAAPVDYAALMKALRVKYPKCKGCDFCDKENPDEKSLKKIARCAKNYL